MNLSDGSMSRAQADWDNRMPDDDGPEPSLDHISEALDILVDDSDLLSTFMMEERPDYTTIFQLMHTHGLPWRDKSDRDDGLIEQYETTATRLLSHYRDWLGDRLTDKSREVMHEAIESAKNDAAEYAAELRRDYMSDAA